jgi:hypothetical protein
MAETIFEGQGNCFCEKIMHAERGEIIEIKLRALFSGVLGYKYRAGAALKIRLELRGLGKYADFERDVITHLNISVGAKYVGNKRLKYKRE